MIKIYTDKWGNSYTDKGDLEMYKILVRLPSEDSDWDITECITHINWNTQLYDTIGSMEVGLIAQKDLKITAGAAISFQVMDNGHWVDIFKGIVVSRSFDGFANSNRNFDGQIKIVAYDLLFFLRGNAGFLVSQSQTFTPAEAIDRMLKVIMPDKYEIKDDIRKLNMKLSTKNYATKNVMEAITEISKEVLINTNGKVWPYIYDGFGKLVIDEVYSNYYDKKSGELSKETLLLNDGSGDTGGVINFNVDCSIADCGYNKIVLFQEHKVNGVNTVSNVSIAEDKAAQAKYGLMLYQEKISENITQADLDRLAQMKLKLFSREAVQMHLDGIGTLWSQGKLLRAGSVVALEGSKWWNYFNIDKYKAFIVEQITHKWEYKKHTMSIRILSLPDEAYTIGLI